MQAYTQITAKIVPKLPYIALKLGLLYNIKVTKKMMVEATLLILLNYLIISELHVAHYKHNIAFFGHIISVKSTLYTPFEIRDRAWSLLVEIFYFF